MKKNNSVFHRGILRHNLSFCCCCSVAKLCSTLCDPVDCSMPGFPGYHSLPEWVCSNSCLLSQWYHPTILSSVAPFSSCPQSFPVSGSFPMSQLFASGGQSTGASASTSVLPMIIQSWFPLGIDWFELLAVQGTLKSLLQHHNLKASILRHSAFFMVQLSLTSIHDYWKNHSFYYTDLCPQSNVSPF